MGIVQKDALRTVIISYLGLILGYINKGFLFLIVFSSTELGLVNLIYSVGMLFANLANLGVNNTAWKFTPFFKNKEKKHFGFLPFMLLIIAVGALLFCTLSILLKPQLIHYYNEKSPLFVEYFYWIIPIGISQVIFNLLEIYLRAFYKNIISVIAQELVLRIVIFTLLILYYFKWISFPMFIYLHSFAFFIPVVILFIYLYRMDELNLKISSISIPRRFKRILFKYNAYNFLNSIGGTLINTLDAVMIAQFLNLTEVGVYTTIIFLLGAIQIPYKAILRVTTPLISEYWKHRLHDKMADLYQKVSSISLFIGLTSFLVIWMNIDFLLSFLRPEFKTGKWIFLFLMIGRVFDMFCGMNSAIFTSSKKYKYDIYFTLLLFIAVYFLNLLFIPKWGSPGAAISTSIALITYNVGRLYFVWKVYKIHPFTLKQVYVFATFCVSLVLCYLFDSIEMHKWLKCISTLILIFFTFIVPIFLFNWEPQSREYMSKILVQLKNKTKK